MAEAKTIEVKVPQILKIENKTENAVAFVPYRENFQAILAKNSAIEFEAETAGQVLYYLGQSKVTVTKISAFDSQSDDLTLIKTPMNAVIKNTSQLVKSFQPYKENFSVDVEAGDTYKIVVKTLGQALYYMGQATDGLTVELEEIPSSS